MEKILLLKRTLIGDSDQSAHEPIFITWVFCIQFKFSPSFFEYDISSNVTFRHVRPAKIQISLRIRAVWSESSLDAVWIAKDVKFLHVYTEDSGQTAWIGKLISVFLERKYQRWHFLRIRFIFSLNSILLSSGMTWWWLPLWCHYIMLSEEDDNYDGLVFYVSFNVETTAVTGALSVETW